LKRVGNEGSSRLVFTLPSGDGSVVPERRHHYTVCSVFDADAGTCVGADADANADADAGRIGKEL